MLICAIVQEFQTLSVRTKKSSFAFGHKNTIPPKKDSKKQAKEDSDNSNDAAIGCSIPPKKDSRKRALEESDIDHEVNFSN